MAHPQEQGTTWHLAMCGVEQLYGNLERRPVHHSGLHGSERLGGQRHRAQRPGEPQAHDELIVLDQAGPLYTGKEARTEVGDAPKLAGEL